MTPLLLLISLAVAAPDTVAIPAGTLRRGSQRAPDEQPVRDIALSGFRIDQDEVTVAEFEVFMADTRGDTTRIALRLSGRTAEHPVVAVSWSEADSYCRWAGGALPTEAQWERAACGTRGGPYPWGARGGRAAQWSEKNDPNAVLHVDTTAADTDPNAAARGVRHMAGNVWEWTADWYHRAAYEQSTGPDPTGPAAGRWRVIRGGSFINLPSYCTCTHREPAQPDQVRLTTGFRCVYPVD
jgi:formylglycine-generating enzyme required for sulfatase activity